MEQPAPLYTRLYRAVTDIQYGRVAHPWTRVVDERPHLYESQYYKYANWRAPSRAAAGAHGIGHNIL